MTKQPLEGAKPYTLTSQWHLLHSIRATNTGVEIALSTDGEWWPTTDVEIVDLEKKSIKARSLCSRCRGMYDLIKTSLDLEYEP